MDHLITQSMRTDIAYWLGLLRHPKFGAVRIARLQRHFTDMREAFFASGNQLLDAEIEPHVIESFLAERDSINPEHELSEVLRHGIRPITIIDAEYPATLRTLHDAPAVLFVRGTLPRPELPLLSVVGTRTPSRYGYEVVSRILPDVIKSGVGIVSGMAHGIDALAHHAALDAHGTTVAVLAGGIDEDSVYPAANRNLAEQILAHGGAIISEFLPGTPNLKQHFPQRNRVVAGLSRATLIVEAAAQSGSLITARCALEAGRDVLAIPGPITSPLSETPNALIRTGATPITSSADLLEALNLTTPREVQAKSAHTRIAPTNPTPYAPASAEEAALLPCLSFDPHHIDELIRACELPSPVVNATLGMLELKGVIKHVGGRYYVRA